MLDIMSAALPSGLNREPLLLGDAYYKVRERLSVSGQAVLYICTDDQENKFVLKLFYENVDYSDEKALKYYSLPRHPHILPLLAHGIIDGRRYELTPYMKNGTLEGKFLTSSELSKTFIRDMNKALCHLHRAGIVHRDVKPSNIFISDDGSHYLLGDLGAISLLGDAPYLQTESGNRTLAFCAPEMLEKKKYISPESDYYSLGLTILTLMRGESPFWGMDNDDISFRIKNDKIPGIDYKKFSQKAVDTRLPSDRLEGLVLGLCRTLPRDRWGSNEVDQWIEGIIHYPVILVKSADNNDYADPFDLLGVKYYNSQTLSVALAENWEFSKKLLKDGIIGDYFRSKSQTITVKLNEVIEDSGNSLDVALFKSLYTIHPSLETLWWKGQSYHSLRQLTSAIREGSSGLNQGFSELLSAGCISFLAQNAECLQNADIDIKKIQEIEEDERTRKGLGLCKLCYYCRIEGTTPIYRHKNTEILNPDMYFNEFFVKKQDVNSALDDMATVDFAAWMWSLGYANKHSAYIESNHGREGIAMQLRGALEFLEDIVGGKHAVRLFAMNHGMYAHIVHLRNNLHQYSYNSPEAIELSSALQLPMISEVISVREIFTSLYKLSGVYNQFVRLTSKNPFNVTFGAGNETAAIIPKNSDGYFIHEKDGFFCSTAFLKSQGLTPDRSSTESKIKALAAETKSGLKDIAKTITGTPDISDGAETEFIPETLFGALSGLVVSSILLVFIVLGAIFAFQWHSPFFIVVFSILAALFPLLAIPTTLKQILLQGAVKSTANSGENILLAELQSRINLIDTSIAPLVENMISASAAAIPTPPDSFAINDYLEPLSKNKRKNNKQSLLMPSSISSVTSCYSSVALTLLALVSVETGFKVMGSGIVPIIIGAIVTTIVLLKIPKNSFAIHYVRTICSIAGSFLACLIVEAFIQAIFGI